MSIWVIFTLLGSLALLMFGMKTMSEALQKMAGPQLRHVLGAMTTNRFTGMLTGTLVTASVQSSTATTVMTVSFVNAGLLTLAQAISVIMGANIGTTLTAWIMSAGMSFDVSSLSYPAFFVGIILIYQKKYRYIGDFLFGIAFLIFALAVLRKTGQDMHLGENQAVLDFFASFDPNSFLTTLVFLVLGGILTFCVQSSAAVMAITMILCSSGALPIYQGIALVMGENIGTTVTSNLAAMSANTQARRAALAHMFFNVFGVIWILFVFRPFIDMVCGWVGYDVDMQKEVVGASAYLANSAKLSFVLAAFHTSFNVVNTFILIWFIPQIERFVCWVIKPKKVDEEEDFRLHFITAGFMKTPELSVLEAQKEIQQFSNRMQRMFGMVRELLTLSSSSNSKKDNQAGEFNKLYTRIEKYEGISDNMELEIANYLNSVSDAHLSDDTKGKIRAMLREVSELESIGDACYKLACLIERKNEHKVVFIPMQQQNIDKMLQLVEQALEQMVALLKKPEMTEADMQRAYNQEDAINALRGQLRELNIASVQNNDYSYQSGMLYMDIINGFEKIGDYVVNVLEAHVEPSNFEQHA